MADFSVEQKKIIDEYRVNQNLSRVLSYDAIISIMEANGDSATLNAVKNAKDVSVFEYGNNFSIGDEINFSAVAKEDKTNFKPELSKDKEDELREKLQNRLAKVSAGIVEAEKNNGIFGKAWSGIKNLLNIGDSSDKVKEQYKKERELLQQGNIEQIFKELTGVDYTSENVNKFLDDENTEVKLKSEQALDGYTEGQEMAKDVTGDIGSGILAMAAYAGVLAAGGPIGIGLVAAVVLGGVSKVGIKAIDGTSKESVLHDFLTGGFSGLLAPVTGGLGGAVGKTIATKLGIQVVKQGTKDVVSTGIKTGIKGGIKNILTNPTGYEYIGNGFVKKAVAYGAEAATDGALGGSVDNTFRAVVDGKSAGEVANASVEGAVGGLFMAPAMTGAFKGIGHFFGKFAKGKGQLENTASKLDDTAREKETIYIRSNNLTKQEVLAKLDARPDLKSNTICKSLIDELDIANGLDKKTQQSTLKLLDMVISCDCLNSNKCLLAKAKRGFLIGNVNGIKFLEKYVNSPELRNNKYITAALGDLYNLFSYKFTQKYANKIVEKFKLNDLSVIDDIYNHSPNIKLYYSNIPKSFAGKEVEDLSENEISILKKWIFDNWRDCNDELLRAIFPAIPTRTEDFTSIVNRIKQVENSRIKILNTEDAELFNHSITAIIKSNDIDSYKNIPSLLPSIFQNNKTVSETTIKFIEKIIKTKKFQQLKDKDQSIVVLSAILQDADKNTEILSKKIVDIGQTLGFSKLDSEKLANITCCIDIISDFIKTTEKEFKNNQFVMTDKQRQLFDKLAFILKDGNTFELAQILYSSNEADDATKFIDKILTAKIYDIKSHNFALPQTPRDSYQHLAQKVTVERNGKTYNVRVVKRSAIPNFQGYVHTPENVSMLQDASVEQNAAKFLLANSENLSERVICGCYVDETSNCFVNNIYYYGRGSGFVLDVPNNKQYVGAGSDISSSEKTRTELIESYYSKNDNCVNPNSHAPKGTKKMELRTLISDNLKEILNISDEEYIRRFDNIIDILGDEILSIENSETIDKEFANAYKTFLSRRIVIDRDFKRAILRNDDNWNEFLFSEAKIKDLYTTHLNMIDEYYLIMGEKYDFIFISMYE